MLIDSFAKVTAERDAGHIHEDRTITEHLDKIVVQSASLSFRIIPPITDKNGAHLETPAALACYSFCFFRPVSGQSVLPESLLCQNKFQHAFPFLVVFPPEKIKSSAD